ncbi:diguanylate cyclase domain-containing protein [Ideonella sp.]|uniref:sensor domain-containing diguanylate cyclase n=1 Tax=Ideonella sp. TaxID=1929293 RepID=UPI0035B3FA2C
MARVKVDAAAKRTRLLATLTLANLVVAGLLVVAVVMVTGASRRAYEAQARDTAEGLAAIAQNNLAAELSAVDVLMRATLSDLDLLRVRGELGDEAIHHALVSHGRLLTGAEGLRLADASGIVRWGNDLRDSVIADISDQPHFVYAREHPDAGVALAGPLRSRVTGHWIMTLARPLVVQGRFDGMLYAAMPLDHFQQLFARYQLNTHDSMALRTADLKLLARLAPGTAGEVAIGSTTMSAELRGAVTANPLRGVLVSRVALDGIERTTAYRRVEGWPLLVLAGVANERFFAPWRTELRQISALAAAAWLLILATTLVAYVAWSSEWRSIQALARQTRLMEAMMRTTADGIHIIDDDGRIIAMSDSFAQMLGTSPDKLMGQHISSWDVHNDERRVADWLAQVHVGDRQRMEVQHRAGDGRILDIDLQLSVTNIEGERFVFASARDITEKKRLQASLEESAARIRDLYDHAPCGYHSLDADGVFVHVNATMLQWLGCSADEVIGHARLVDYLDDEGRAIFAANFPQVKKEGHLDGLELKLVPRHGPVRYLRASVTAIVDASGQYVSSRSVTQDVTAQHEAWVETARVMREQTAMLDNDIVAMVKLRDRVMVWKNRALDRLFGYAPGELDDQSARLLYPDDLTYETLGAQAYPVLGAGVHFRTQLELRHKDGHLLWIDLSGVSLGDGLSLWMMVDITAMKDLQAQMEHIAFHDALTGLPNRLLLADRMRQSILSCQRSGTFVAVCYLDLDGFKQVNDHHGHEAGDALLVEIGRRLQSCLRANDTAGRVGGDEFVVLLTMLAEPTEWQEIVPRLIDTLQAPVALPGGALARVGTSVGVALAPLDGVEPSVLLAKADQAMLRAKRGGKGRVELASLIEPRPVAL